MRSLFAAALLVTACARNPGPSSDVPDAHLQATHVAAYSIARGKEASLAETAVPPTRAAEALVLTHARLIDGTGQGPKEDVDILISAGTIAKIESGLVVPAGARVIDLGGRTLLPGFIDSHVHLTYSPSDDYATGVVEALRSSEADAALDGVVNARRTLEAGFTTVRVVGGGFSDRALRDAIVAGHVAGPRMLVANHAIGITGGHCDGTNAMHPDAFPTRTGIEAGVADGPDEVRAAVRYQIKHGADVIKVCATGGVMSQGDAVGVTQMSPEELRAAVEVATAAERKVAAHAHGTEGIHNAIAAGVASVEHGSILDREAIAMMKKRGTFLVPTLYVARAVEAQAASGALSASSAAKVAEITPQMRASFTKALQAGVKIALGSDAGVFEHGENGHEFEEMVGQGMPEMDAIVAGTASAAELLGLDNVGTVAPGMLADMVVVHGDPLADITELQKPAMVIKGGVVQVAPTWVE